MNQYDWWWSVFPLHMVWTVLQPSRLKGRWHRRSAETTRQCYRLLGIWMEWRTVTGVESLRFAFTFYWSYSLKSSWFASRLVASPAWTRASKGYETHQNVIEWIRMTQSRERIQEQAESSRMFRKVSGRPRRLWRSCKAGKTFWRLWRTFWRTFWDSALRLREFRSLEDAVRLDPQNRSAQKANMEGLVHEMGGWLTKLWYEALKKSNARTSRRNDLNI